MNECVCNDSHMCMHVFAFVSCAVLTCKYLHNHMNKTCMDVRMHTNTQIIHAYMQINIRIYAYVRAWRPAKS
jgi:hypothetical protein